MLRSNADRWWFESHFRHQEPFRAEGSRRYAQRGVMRFGYHRSGSGPWPTVQPKGNFNELNNLLVSAKISLVGREQQVVATSWSVAGSGFNDGTTATAWVLGRQVTTAEWWNALDCDDMNALVDPNDADTDAVMGTSPCTMYAGLDAYSLDPWS